MRLKEGDIVAVPVESDSLMLCRVLYKSQYFKHVALVGCYGRFIESLPVALQLQSGLVGVPLYTTVQPKKIGSWQRLDNQQLSEQEIQLSLRIVAGDVWLGDNHLGAASETELASLPQMDVYGDRLFARRISNNVSSLPTARGGRL